MSELPRQHGDLSSMMRIVRNEVSDETRDIRAEAPDPSIRL